MGGKPKILTDEQDAWLVANCNNEPGKVSVEKLNAHFGTSYTYRQVIAAKKRLDLTSNGHRPFTKAQEAWIAERRKGVPYRDMTRRVNEQFGLSVTMQQVKALYNRRKWKNGNGGQFKKGRKPWNSGLKGLHIAGAEVGRFQPGHCPKNARPVGSERVLREGYTEVKVAEPNVWALKHRHLYEQAYGPIDPSHVVIFLDGNRQNTALENLKSVPRAILPFMKNNKLFTKDPEITATGATLATLVNATSKRRKSLKGGE